MTGHLRWLAPATFLALWSAGFAFVVLGLPDSAPITFLALRYAIVVAVLVPALLVLRPPLPRARRDWLDLIVVGLLLQAAYFTLLYLALDLESSAGTVALIVPLQPILVALLAPSVAGERVTKVRWAGLALGLIGAAVVIGSRSTSAAPRRRAWHVRRSPCGSDGGNPVRAQPRQRTPSGHRQRRPVRGCARRHPAARAVPRGLSGRLDGRPGDLTRLPRVRQLARVDHTAADDGRRGEASRVSSLFFLVPPLAALIAWAVLGESLPASAWLGMALAAVGVGIATSSSARDSS